MHPTRLALLIAALLPTAFLSRPAAAAESVAADPSADAEAPTDLDRVQVLGQRYLPEYSVRRTRSATRTDTPLRDVPQAITVVTDKLIEDQAMTGLADTFRYLPGVGTAQGEGNRDTPVLRGIATTADFFVDGMRDDVQYIRDLYNVERVEALKGPNALVFGRGGSGGVINRITRQADGEDHRALSLLWGSWGRRRASVDLGTGIGEAGAGVRINAMAEDSGSFRHDVRLKRHGVNPTLGLALGEATRLQLGYERFQDERTADRGVPSAFGRPLDIPRATFVGNPQASPVEATVDAFDAVLTHTTRGGLELRNHLRWADYDKFYQNVFPTGYAPATGLVSLGAYSNATRRRNLFNQTDAVWTLDAGGVRHTLLAGAEFGRQVTDNRRLTGYFGSATSLLVPLADPTTAVVPDFRPSATDADNHGIARSAAVYVQDQIAFGPHWQAILGVRHDDFRMELRNNRTGGVLRTRDRVFAPRAGLVYKPAEALSLYASYSDSYLPRAGEQLAALTASNAALSPERLRNRELGLKWDLRPDLQASWALYRLTRHNVAITDPADPTRLILVDGQTADGMELGLAGRVNARWQLMGGYAWQKARIDSTQSASVRAGNRVAMVPTHSASLWNRYDFNDRWGVGLGVVYRGAVFANADDLVRLPGFTRVDAAVFWTLSPSLRLQLNIENLGDRRYFASAHSNQNISPGAPRNAWLGVNLRF